MSISKAFLREVLRLLDPKIVRFIRNVLLALGAVSIALLAGHHFIYAYGARGFMWEAKLFNLDGEQNVPAWVATCIWFTTSLGAMFAFYVEKRTNFTKTTPYWLFIAALFSFLSLDELAEVHELLGVRGRRAFELTPIGDFIHNFIPDSPWLFFYLPPLVVVGLISLWFLWTRFRPYRGLLILTACSGFLYAVAVGNEYFQSIPLKEFDRIGNALVVGADTCLNLSVMIEETSENLATACLFLAFFGYACQKWIEAESLNAEC